MKKILVFSILLLTAIAVTIGTTITTTIQIQPAYSQAQHCSADSAGSSTCVILGQDQLIISCDPVGGCDTNGDPSGREIGTSIGLEHHNCGQSPNSVTCTVTPPKGR